MSAAFVRRIWRRLEPERYASARRHNECNEGVSHRPERYSRRIGRIGCYVQARFDASNIDFQLLRHGLRVERSRASLGERCQRDAQLE